MKKFLDKAQRMQMTVILLADLISGDTFSKAGAKYGLSTGETIEAVQSFVRHIREKHRWGKFVEIDAILAKPVRVIVELHYDLLEEARRLVQLEYETYCEDAKREWDTPKARRLSDERTRTEKRKSTVWTKDMDAILGTDADNRIAQRLNVEVTQLAKRRKELGIMSYQSRITAAPISKEDRIKSVNMTIETARTSYAASARSKAGKSAGPTTHWVPTGCASKSAPSL